MITNGTLMHFLYKWKVDLQANTVHLKLYFTVQIFLYAHCKDLWSQMPSQVDGFPTLCLSLSLTSACSRSKSDLKMHSPAPPLPSSLLLKALLYLYFLKPTTHTLANTLACKTHTLLHKHTLFANALVHTHIESLISAPFSCLLGPLQWLQRSLGGRSFHSLAQ